MKWKERWTGNGGNARSNARSRSNQIPHTWRKYSPEYQDSFAGAERDYTILWEWRNAQVKKVPLDPAEMMDFSTVYSCGMQQAKNKTKIT